MHFGQGFDGGVPQGVCRRAGGVGVVANSGSVVGDIVAKNVIGDRGRLLLGPLSQSIGPALAHATGFGGLQAGSGATAGETVGDSVGHFVDDDVVLECTITLDLL